MKVILIALVLVSFLQSDEMQRMESIIEDITKLRAQNEECQESLKNKITINDGYSNDKLLNSDKTIKT